MLISVEISSPADSFDYFMVYYSIVLGIAITELFVGIGRLLQCNIKLRNAALTLTFCVVVFLETVTNFIDVWDRPEQLVVTLPNLAQYTAIGGACVILALLAVPPDVSADSSPDDYFRKKRTLFGFILVAGGIPIIFSDIGVLQDCKGKGNNHAFPIWLVGNVGLFFGYFLMTRRTSASAVAAMALIVAFYLAFYIDDPTDCFDRLDPGWFGVGGH